jgi:hypothetical protein
MRVRKAAGFAKSLILARIGGQNIVLENKNK